MTQTVKLTPPRTCRASSAGCSLIIPIIAAATFAASATAQTPQSAVIEPPTSTVAVDTEIVVSADRKAETSTIDRKTYDVTRDLSAGAGSAADVLRNLPSVEVDASGDVSLRGDSNVQILIDGKPSAQMSPATRADALQSLPANGIARVEVIANPSARFKAEGSAGVINIITKRSRQPGLSGSATASTGTDGRYNLGGTVAYRRSVLDLNAALTLRRDVPKRPFIDRRTEVDTATGARSDSAQDLYFTSNRTSKIATFGAGYDLTNADRLSGSITYNDRSGSPLQTERNRLFDATGRMTSDYDRDARGTEHEVATEGSATFKHSFTGNDHAFTLDVRRGDEAENQSRRFINVYRVPVLPYSIDEQRPHDDMVERELTAEYARPLAAHAKLLIGYDLQRNDDAFDAHDATIDPSGAAIPIPALASRFVYAQTVHSFYGTYERVFAEKLTVIVGFRVEATSTDANQVTIAQIDHAAYVDAYPTLHLDYAQSDATTLRLSYSHRIVRPRPEDLDPFPVFQDPLNLKLGNPRLKPQATDAVEATVAYASHGVSASLTPYYRRTTNLFTQVTRFISPTVLLTTQENLGRSTVAGTEFAVNGKFGAALAFGVSGTLFYNTIDATSLGIAGKRSIVSRTAKANVDYQWTRNDLIQFTASYTGDRLLPQGYRLSGASANLGFRHQLTPKLSVVAALSDIFDSLKDRAMLDTATLHETTTRRRSTRTGTIALAWTFGGPTKKKDAKFDYSYQE